MTRSSLARMLAGAGDSTLTFFVGARVPDALTQSAGRSGFEALPVDGWWDDGYRYRLVAVIGASEKQARRLGSRHRAMPVHVVMRDGQRVISLLQPGGGTTGVGAWSDDAVLRAIASAAGCGQCVGIAYPRRTAGPH